MRLHAQGSGHTSGRRIHRTESSPQWLAHRAGQWTVLFLIETKGGHSGWHTGRSVRMEDMARPSHPVPRPDWTVYRQWEISKTESPSREIFAAPTPTEAGHCP